MTTPLQPLHLKNRRNVSTLINLRLLYYSIFLTDLPSHPSRISQLPQRQQLPLSPQAPLDVKGCRKVSSLIHQPRQQLSRRFIVSYTLCITQLTPQQQIQLLPHPYQLVKGCRNVSSLIHRTYLHLTFSDAPSHYYTSSVTAGGRKRQTIPCNHDDLVQFRREENNGYFATNYLANRPYFPRKCGSCGISFGSNGKNNTYKVGSNTPVHECRNARVVIEQACGFALCDPCFNTKQMSTTGDDANGGGTLLCTRRRRRGL